MEEGELLGDGLLDEPAAGVAAQDGGEAGVEIVGEQQGGAAPFAAQDGDLAQFAAEVAQRDGFVVGGDQARARGGGDADAAQGGLVKCVCVGEQALAAATDGDEQDALLVEAGEAGVGGETAVEDKVADGRAVAAEEVEELEGGAGAGLVADAAGVGLQEQAGVRVLGEGGGDADEGAAAGAGPMLLQGGVIAPVGQGGEIEVGGVAGEALGGPDGGEGPEQALVHGARGAIGIRG